MKFNFKNTSCWDWNIECEIQILENKIFYCYHNFECSLIYIPSYLGCDDFEILNQSLDMPF